MRRSPLLKIIAIALTVSLASSFSVFSGATAISNPQFDDQYPRDPMSNAVIPFIQNVGQADQEVQFYLDGKHSSVFVTSDGALTYLFSKKTESAPSDQMLAVSEVFLNGTPTPAGLDRSETTINYFVGPKESWHTNIPSYNRIGLGQVWKGVNVELKANGGNVEKIFNVLPYGNIDNIAIAIEGIEDLDIDLQGRLVLKTAFGDAIMTKPVAFQDIEGVRKPVAVSYTVQDMVYGFDVVDPSYNPRYPLTIDPLLASTFFGSSSTEAFEGVGFDSSGNVFVTGWTLGSTYPTTSGVVNQTSNGGTDIVVTKFNSGLTSALASTYLGGFGADSAFAIALDSSGNVYLTGSARTGFPTTAGAFDTTNDGGDDVFVAKLSNNLSTLVASTFIGGTSAEYANSIVISSTGDVYVAGATQSSGFPASGTHAGSDDGFISKLNSGLTSSTSRFLGGTGSDIVWAIAFDSSGNVFVTGETASSDYPTTAGAYDTTRNGAFSTDDVFVTKLNNTLGILASTFVGGTESEAGYGIVIDSSGNVYVAGQSNSDDYPTTVGAYDTTFAGTAGGSNTEVIVSKLSNNLATLSASTYVGNSGADSAFAIALDSSGNVYVGGYTDSAAYPVTSGAYDQSYNGSSSDAIISKLNSSLSSLLASTFVGGSSDEFVYALKIDSSDNVHVAGETRSANYPVTTGAADTSHNGVVDGFVSIFSGDLLLVNGPPTGTVVINAGAASTTSTSATLTLSCTDDATSCSEMKISVDGVFDTESFEAFATTKSVTLSAGEGLKVVSAIFKDTTGNTATAVNDDIALDATTPPAPGIIGQEVTLSSDNTPTITGTHTANFLFGFGGHGSGDGEFDFPSGVAIDSFGNIYVTDTGNSRVQKFNSTGGLILEWGTFGTGNGQFNEPVGIVADSSDNVYVVDQFNKRIQKFNSTGGFILKWGSAGSGNGQFNTPDSIAIDSSGNVYVTDTSNDRVQKFDSNGTFITKWGSSGSGNGQFSEPTGIAIDSSGSVYVSDSFNDRVQKFNSTGGFVTKWGSFGTGNGQFSFPLGIAVDDAGSIYVVDHSNARVQKFTSTGTFLTKWGSLGSDAGQFDSPHGIAIDANGNILVVDVLDFGIQKFEANVGDATVKVYDRNTLLGSTAVPPAGEWSFTPSSALSNGVHYISATVTDSAGFVSGPSSPAALYVFTTMNLSQSASVSSVFPNIAASGNNIHVVWQEDLSGNSEVFYTNSTNGGSTFGNAVNISNNAGNSTVPYLAVDGSNVHVVWQEYDSSTSSEQILYKKSSDGGKTFGSAVTLSNYTTNFPLDSFNPHVTASGNNVHVIWSGNVPPTGRFTFTTGIAIDSSGNVYVGDRGNNRIQKFNNTGGFITTWGRPGSADGQFGEITGVATDSSGNVYVVDYTNNRIQKFSSTGTFITKWGSSGSGNGQFNNPSDVVVDSSGNVYIADTFNDRIQKFTSTGTFLTKWGFLGSGDGNFTGPRGIAVDPFDNVYVADSGNNRVQKFDSLGNFISKFGSFGTGNGAFSFPTDVGADMSNVYVVDSDNNRIQKFDNSFVFVTKWGSSGTGDGQFDGPNKIAIESSGNNTHVYVTDEFNSRVQKFNNTGTFITKWGTHWDGEDDILYRRSTDGGANFGTAINLSNNDSVSQLPYVAVNGTNVYAIWEDETPGNSDIFFARSTNGGASFSTAVNISNNTRVSANGHIIPGAGNDIHVVWEDDSGDGQFDDLEGVAVDSSGNVYVVDTGNARIQKFNSSGTFLIQFGESGSFDGEFDDPVGIAVDSSGNIYVADSSNERIQKFNSTGGFITKWGSFGTGDGQFSDLEGVAVDSSGNVYAADAGNDRIQKFNSTGGFITKWGSFGTGDGQFNDPEGVAVDSSGNVYVIDSRNYRVQKFTSTGTFITKWGSFGEADGEFVNPFNIAVDSSGNVYVADTYNNRVQKFTSTGTFITKWGSFGEADGEFDMPDGIAVSSSSVFVADTRNDRIQKFDQTGTFVLTWGSEFLGEAQVLYKRSTNGGATFSSPATVLSDSVDSSTIPYVAYSSGRIFAVWENEADSTDHDIILKKSTSDCQCFGDELTLSGSVNDATFPESAVSGSNLFVVWQEEGSPEEVLYARLVDFTTSAPFASNHTTVTDEDTAISIDLEGADADLDELAFAIVTGPTKGTLGSITPTSFTTATVTYTPNANANGADSFTFKVNDGSSDSPAATVSITINAINDVPVATAQSVTTNEDTTKTITLRGTDVEGSSLTFSIVSSPVNGTLGSLNSINATAASVIYTPNGNFSGSNSFAFRVNDGTQNSTNSVVSITITAVNDAPVVNSQSVSTNEDTAKSITLTGSDVENTPLTFSILANPTHGSISGFNPVLGILTYTPSANFNGTDSFTFRASDGSLNSNNGTVSITITAVNDVPVANAGSDQNVNEGTLVTLNGTASSDVETSSLTYSWSQTGGPAVTLSSASTVMPTFTAPSVGSGGATLTFSLTANDGTATSPADSVTITVFDGPAANSQSVTTNEDTQKVITLTGSDINNDFLNFAIVSAPSQGSLTSFTRINSTAVSTTYTPTVNYNGPDSFTFKVNDGSSDSLPATVSITISAVNDAPTATAQSATTNEDTAKSLTLAGSDAEGSTLTFAIVTSPTRGTLSGFNSANGAVTYTPNANANGADSFTFTTNDGSATSSPATVSITITPVNDAPVASPSGPVEIVEGGFVGLDGTASSDVDGNTLTYQWSLVSSNPSGTSVTLSSNTASRPTFTAPDVLTNTTLQFQLVVSDGTLTSSATVSVKIIDQKGTLKIQRILEGTSTLIRNATTITITPDPRTLTGSLSIQDNQGGSFPDFNSTAGVIELRNVEFSTYTVAETNSPDSAFSRVANNLVISVHRTLRNATLSFTFIQTAAPPAVINVPPPSLTSTAFNTFNQTGATIGGTRITTVADLPPAVLATLVTAPPATIVLVNSTADSATTTQQLISTFNIPTYPAPDDQLARDKQLAVPPIILNQTGSANKFLLTPVLERTIAQNTLVISQEVPVASGTAKIQEVEMQFSSTGSASNVAFSFAISDANPTTIELPEDLAETSALFLNVGFVGNFGGSSDFSSESAFETPPQVKIQVSRTIDIAKLEDGCPDITLLLFSESTSQWSEVRKPTRLQELDTSEDCGYVAEPDHFSKFAVGGVKISVQAIAAVESLGRGGSPVDLSTLPESYFAQFPLTKVQVSALTLLDAQNDQVSQMTAGKQVSIASTFKNYQSKAQTYAYIVMVTDNDGATAGIDYQLGQLPAGQTTTVSVSWVPPEQGQYQIRVFLWDSLSQVPVPISSVQTSSISVSP